MEFQEKSENQQVKKQPSRTPGMAKKWGNYCRNTGHVREECRKLLPKKEKESQPSGDSKGYPAREKAPIKCFNCRKEGHIAADCPSIIVRHTLPQILVSRPEDGVVRWKASMSEIVLDTGCKSTMVRQELVPQEKILDGDVATIRCAHGDTVFYPLAKI